MGSLFGPSTKERFDPAGWLFLRPLSSNDRPELMLENAANMCFPSAKQPLSLSCRVYLKLKNLELAWMP